MRARLLKWSLVTAFLIAGYSFVSAAAGIDDLPYPLSGPGHPELKKSQKKRMNKAWVSLTKGNRSAAEKSLRKAGTSEATTLIRLQMDLLSGDGEPLSGLVELANQDEGYAAAWVTLSLAAEWAGDEAIAFASAGRVAELWPDSKWSSRAGDLRTRWIEVRLTTAEQLLADGEAQKALDELAPALTLESDNRRGLMGRARALVSLDQLDQAEEVLGHLPDDSEAQMLYGHIAEIRGDWQTAMNRYQELPPDTPGRAESLGRAQLRWRLSLLPRHVQRAMTSEELTRAGLAVVVVALVPQIDAVGGGRVRVLSDIVDLQSQREIVTVVRLELMATDPLEHRFHPGRMVSAAEVRTALDRLGELLQMRRPVWCDDATVVSSECTTLFEPIRGEDVANLVLGMAYGNDS